MNREREGERLCTCERGCVMEVEQKKICCFQEGVRERDAETRYAREGVRERKADRDCVWEREGVRQGKQIESILC